MILQYIMSLNAAVVHSALIGRDTNFSMTAFRSRIYIIGKDSE